MAHATLFLSGHGGWKPSYGYARTPRGVSVVFYTHFAKNLVTSMEDKILDGSYTQSDRVIGEFSQCPNMEISGQPEAWTANAEAKLNKQHWGSDAHVLGVPEGKEANLNEFFDLLSREMSQGDTLTLHWLACSTLQLKQQGGRALGLNAADYQHDQSAKRFRIKNVNGTFTWV